MMDLQQALSSSDLVVCNGYEIDNWWPTADGTTRLMCGDDEVAIANTAQVIELNQDGQATVVSIEGGALNFEFKVLTPLSPKLHLT